MTIVGVIVILFGEFFIFRAAFAESRKWGFICLFIPGAWLIFTILHWGSAMKGFLVLIAGIAIAAVGITVDEFEKQKKLQEESRPF